MGEEVEKCNENIKIVEGKVMELQDKLNSEISILKAWIIAGSVTSNRSAIVAEVGQTTEARIADGSPTTPNSAGVSQHST